MVTQPPGTLLHHEPIETSITGANAWKVRYTSRDVNGVAQESTGLVIAPAAQSENRPTFTWCHGTTGLGDAACPSAQPDPACELMVAAVDAGSAGERKPVAPVLVCIDSFHNGSVVPVSWQTGYVDAVKELGGTVETRDYPNDDHFSLPANCAADARAWLTSKLS